MSSYTWGHAIDDRPGQGASRVEDNYNLKAERGDADFDVRHHWTLSGVYELPFGPGRKWIANSKRIAGAFLSGWNLSGIATIQGGRPFSVILTQDISGSLNLADRPNLVPGVSWKPEDQGPNHWINPAAFSIPASGTFGNLGRNTLRGPRLIPVEGGTNRQHKTIAGSRRGFQCRQSSEFWTAERISQSISQSCVAGQFRSDTGHCRSGTADSAWSANWLLETAKKIVRVS